MEFVRPGSQAFLVVAEPATRDKVLNGYRQGLQLKAELSFETLDNRAIRMRLALHQYHTKSCISLDRQITIRLDRFFGC